MSVLASEKDRTRRRAPKRDRRAVPEVTDPIGGAHDSRPRVGRRLVQSIERRLGADPSLSLTLAQLRKKLSILTQEKRFLIFLFLMSNGTRSFSADQLTTALHERRGNIVRNLHMLVAENIVLLRQEETSVHFSINRKLVFWLSEVFSLHVPLKDMAQNSLFNWENQ